MAGDAVARFQKGLREFPLGVAEKFHTGTGLAAAEHSAKGDRQDVVPGMATCLAGLARGSSRALNRLANSVMAASPLLQSALRRAALAAIIPNTAIFHMR